MTAERKEENAMAIEKDIAEAAAWVKSLAHEGEHLRLDSRAVRPGDVFVAVPGATVDGRNFIRVAAARGAAGVLYEARDDVPAGEHYPVAARGVKNLKARLGEVAAAFYDMPSARMTGIAVTGTNGKTTTAFWTAQLLTKLGAPCGVIGTVGTFFNGRTFEAPELTTPDAVSLQGIYADLAAAGAKAFAVEASSVGLEQGRLTGSAFSVGIFTNLSRDHLDYHRTMQAYEAAKAELFRWPGLGAAVLNANDPVSAHFASVACEHGAALWFTGTDGRASELARAWPGARVLEADQIAMGERGMRFRLTFGELVETVEIAQLGVFNIENMLGVAAAALACGYSFDAVVAQLGALEAPPGRLEPVYAEGMPLGVVDFAHTPDGLEKTLESLAPAARARGGKLWVVFGCGGDRDPGKRPMMGEIAAKLAERVVVTSDNPRSEPPEAICRAVEAGARRVESASPVDVIVDRREAVIHAVLEAEPRDIVLVAGKGHETEQITREGAHHFSDVEVLREAFNERRVRLLAKA